MEWSSTHETGSNYLVWSSLRCGLLAGVLALAACAGPSSNAPSNAVLGTGPDAGSFLVVGLAEQNTRRDMMAVTDSMLMRLDGPGGSALFTRFGCGSVRGFYGSGPCELSKVERYVLAVRPGAWRPALVAELQKGTFSNKRIQDELPRSRPVEVRPGEVVYLGDFTVATDYEAQEMRLVSHGRDDAAARAAVAKYPGLAAAPVRYADPTLKP